MTVSTEDRNQFLVWLYQTESGAGYVTEFVHLHFYRDPPGGYPSLGILSDWPGPKEWNGTDGVAEIGLYDLERMRLIIIGYGLAKLGGILQDPHPSDSWPGMVTLTPAGGAAAQKQYNQFVRNAVVEWLYSGHGHRGPWDAMHGIMIQPELNGRHVHPQALTAAVEHLLSSRFIEPDSQVHGYRLTRKGITFVEQSEVSMGEFDLQESRHRPSHSLVVNGSFQGVGLVDGYGTVHQDNRFGTPPNELIALARLIARDVPALGLPPAEAGRLTRDIQHVEAELGDGSDAEIVRPIMRRVLTTLGAAANSATALVLTGYAKELMNRLGIPSS